MNQYTIQITPNNKQESYTIELVTDNIKWSMEQYQRNREAFSWEVIARIPAKTNYRKSK